MKLFTYMIQNKELNKRIHNQSCNIDVRYYDIPKFASKEIILYLSKRYSVDEVMLDRLTYEAEHNINC